MAFTSLIAAATKYAGLLPQEKIEITFRETVKDKFMESYLAAIIGKSEAQIAAFKAQIKADAPKAAKKTTEWAGKPEYMGDPSKKVEDSQVIEAAVAFEKGRKELKADKEYQQYRAAREELKVEVAKLGKGGIDLETIVKQLKDNHLEKVEFRARQLYKYTDRD